MSVKLGVTGTGGFSSDLVLTAAKYTFTPFGYPGIYHHDTVADVTVRLVRDNVYTSEPGVYALLRLGGEVFEFWKSSEDITPDDPLWMSGSSFADLRITVLVQYPTELVSQISVAGRKDLFGAIAGPRPRTTPPGDDTDTRGWTSADIGWGYYGGGFIDVHFECTHRQEPYPYGDGSETPMSFDWHLDGPETHAGVDFIQCSSCEGGGLAATYWNGSPEGSLTVSSPWGSPNCARVDEIIEWDGYTIGGTSVVANRASASFGSEHGAPDYGWFVFQDIAGPTNFYLRTSCINAAGQPYSSVQLELNPQDGPAQIVSGDWDVNHFFPFLDGNFTDGTTLTHDVPGLLSRQAEHYDGHVDVKLDGARTTYAHSVRDTSGPRPMPFGFSFNPGVLEDHNFESDAWRAPILLPGTAPLWQAATVHFQPELTIHDFDADVEGWIASAGTVAATGGALVMGGGANPKIASVDWLNQLQNNFRYLRIRIKADDADIPVRFKCGAKTWEGVANTEYADWHIDLCAPTNLSGDNQDLSRAERLWSAGAVATSQGGWPWGLEVEKNMDTLAYNSVTVSIEADTSNQIFIDSIAGLEKGTERCWAVVGEQVQEDSRFRARDDSDTEVFLKRQLLLVRNGHMVEELWCGTTWTPPDSVTGQKEAHSVETIASMFSAYGFSNDPGAVTRVKPAAPGAGPFDNSAPAYMLKPGWYEIRDGSGITAHYAADRIRLWDGVNNLVFECLRMLGGGIGGLLADADGAIPSEIVDVKLAGALRDHSTTDVHGEFFTPDASVAGLTVTEGPWDVIQRSVPANADAVGGILDCVIMRDNLAASVESSVAEGKDSAKSVTGNIYRVFGRAGSLWLDRYVQSLKNWSAPAELFTGAYPAITVTDGERDRRIRLTYSVSGAMKERTSGDDAATWSAEVDLSIAGTHKDRLIDEDCGNEYLFYYSGGAIYMRRRSLYSGTAWSSASPVTVVSSAGDDAITAQLFSVYDSLSAVRKRRLQLSYTTAGGSIADVISSDDGATWS